MRFSVDRICELAGLGTASGGLISEAAIPSFKSVVDEDAAMEKPVTKTAGVKPAPVKAAAAPASKPAPAPVAEEDEPMDEYDDMGYDMGDDSYMWDDMGSLGYGGGLNDNAMYEIEEEELMEALVDMRQARLEESAVRDAVRDEIARALSDKSSSWMYGSNKPTASRQGQIARGGFGVGFGFKR